jgi:hypothetical protein
VVDASRCKYSGFTLLSVVGGVPPHESGLKGVNWHWIGTPDRRPIGPPWATCFGGSACAVGARRRVTNPRGRNRPVVRISRRRYCDCKPAYRNFGTHRSRCKFASFPGGHVHKPGGVVLLTLSVARQNDAPAALSRADAGMGTVWARGGVVFWEVLGRYRPNRKDGH